MIKIYHIIPTLGTGGAEKLVVDLCKNINKEQFSASIVTFHPVNNSIFIDDLKESNIEIISFDKKLGFDYKLIFQLNKLFKNNKPDIIHTHLYSVPYVIFPSIIQKIKVRVHTVHSIAQKEFDSKIKKIIMRLAYKYFRFVPVGIGDYVKETIAQEYSLPIDKIPCIYNGIDTSKYTPNYKKNDSDIVLVNVARLCKEKNHQLLLEAFNLVKNEIHNIKLNIVGDGELRKEIEKQIQELNIEKSVFLRGNRKNVNEELGNADLFVLSSNYEGIPISVLEAMSCSLPIITTNAGGVINLVENNKNGIVTNKNTKEELSKAIIRLCKNDDLRREMGKNSAIMSKKFDIKITTKKYEKLYMNLLNKRRKKNVKREIKR